MGLFEGMPTQCVQAIRHVSSLVAFKGGATIFREGEIAYKMYEVFSGEVEITRKAPDRGEIVLETLGKDGVFGEAGLLSGTHQRAGSARAKSDAVLYEISQDPVDRCGDSCPCDRERGRLPFRTAAKRHDPRNEADGRDALHRR